MRRKQMGSDVCVCVYVCSIFIFSGQEMQTNSVLRMSSPMGIGHKMRCYIDKHTTLN